MLTNALNEFTELLLINPKFCVYREILTCSESVKALAQTLLLRWPLNHFMNAAIHVYI